MKSSLIWMRDEMRWEALATHRLFQKLRLSYPTYIVVNIFYLLLWETRLDFHMREHHALPHRERERERAMSHSAPTSPSSKVTGYPGNYHVSKVHKVLSGPHETHTHTHEECKYIAIYIYIYMTWLLVVVIVRFYCLWFFAFVFRFL